MNPIKKLNKIIKTPRLELRQLDVTPENAKLIYDAVKNERPEDFFYNQIGNKNIIPVDADEMFCQMQRADKWAADNGVNLYIFLDGRPIGYRRIFSLTMRQKHYSVRRCGWSVPHGGMDMPKNRIKQSNILLLKNLGLNVLRVNAVRKTRAA